MRILFAGTSVSQSTGYARITYMILKYLDKIGHKVFHFAFQDYSSNGVDCGRRLPNSISVINATALAKNIFGDDIWLETIQNIRPDVIIVYNDLIVSSLLINAMIGEKKPCPFISYLDIVYPFQNKTYLDHVINYSDHVFVFSEFWKKHLTNELGYPENKLSVFQHGVDKIIFREIKFDRKMINVDENDFIVLNFNRNSYRKLLDVSIKAFVNFFKRTGCASNVKLMIHCNLDITEGYNIIDIIKNACKKEDVDENILLNTNIIMFSNKGQNVSDEEINTAVNASDIGINTCGGEGFGLCNAEGGYLKKPQIVSNVGGLSDIFEGFTNMLVNPKLYMTLAKGIESQLGELAICDYKDFADKMLFYYQNRDILRKDGEKIHQRIREKYDWDKLLKKFSDDLNQIIKQ